MFVLRYFLEAVASLIDWVFWLYMLVIIARALISWVSPDPYNPIVRFLYQVTEPVLRPIRHRLPTWGGGIDFSPLVVLLAIFFLQAFLVRTLRHLAWAIG